MNNIYLWMLSLANTLLNSESYIIQQASLELSTTLSILYDVLQKHPSSSILQLKILTDTYLF